MKCRTGGRLTSEEALLRDQRDLGLDDFVLDEVEDDALEVDVEDDGAGAGAHAALGDAVHRGDGHEVAHVLAAHVALHVLQEAPQQRPARVQRAPQLVRVHYNLPPHLHLIKHVPT